MSDILEVLRNLPSLGVYHPLLGDRNPATWPDWFQNETLYPNYVELAHALQPKTILEIGSLVGYSLISLLHGSDVVERIFWIDNEEYVTGSNGLSANNLDYYLRTRVVKRGYGSKLTDIPKEDFELINIDGDHSYAGKIRDLSFALTKNPKWIILDDYCKLSEVHDAIDDFAMVNCLSFFLIETFERGIVLFDLSPEQEAYNKILQSDLRIVMRKTWKK
jgi:hypothetical protein